MLLPYVLKLPYSLCEESESLQMADSGVSCIIMKFSRHFFQYCLCNRLVLYIQMELHSKNMVVVINSSDLIPVNMRSYIYIYIYL